MLKKHPINNRIAVISNPENKKRTCITLEDLRSGIIREVRVWTAFAAEAEAELRKVLDNYPAASLKYFRVENAINMIECGFGY